MNHISSLSIKNYASWISNRDQNKIPSWNPEIEPGVDSYVLCQGWELNPMSESGVELWMGNVVGVKSRVPNQVSD